MDTTLPSVNERLADLKPTKDLLEFYREKLKQCETGNEEIIKKLKDFKSTCEHQFALEKTLVEKDEEILVLRKSLSDIQACLYQEREHCLKLYSENNRLKIHQLEDNKKIKQLLALCGEKYPTADLVYLMSDRTNVVYSKKQDLKCKHSKASPVANTEDLNCNEILNLKMEAMRKELEDQSKLFRENLELLSEDCRVTREESDLTYRRHTTKIQSLNERLKNAQDLLQKVTESYLDQKRKRKNEEATWLKQRDDLVLSLNNLKTKLPKECKVDAATNFSKTTVLQSTQTNNMRQRHEAVQAQLEKAQKMTDLYKNQCLKLEGELSHLKEEKNATISIYNERSERLSNRLKLIISKYEDLEKRHKLEVAGFRSDVKILRSQLQKVEKQLLKTAIKLTQSQEDEMLETVHATAIRSKHLSDNIRALKSQIYNLEQDLRLC